MRKATYYIREDYESAPPPQVVSARTLNRARRAMGVGTECTLVPWSRMTEKQRKATRWFLDTPPSTTTDSPFEDPPESEEAMLVRWGSSKYHLYDQEASHTSARRTMCGRAIPAHQDVREARESEIPQKSRICAQCLKGRD